MTQDPLENLLQETFSDALKAQARAAERSGMTTAVLAAIRRKERLRTISLVLLGCLAATICISSGLPLLLTGVDLLPGLLTERAWLETLAETPPTGILLGAGLLLGWLLLLAEEG